MRSIEVLVVGGGASGMMAALMAARQGAFVLLLEKKNIPGKKLLATGNGKCNYSNSYQNPACYHVEEDSVAWRSIEQFGFPETLKFFLELGVFPQEKGGYLYPVTGQAASVRNVLENELHRSGVEIKTEAAVLSIEQHISGKGKPDGFVVSTEKEKYLAKKVVLATGGKAGPAHGSEGDGYSLLNPFAIRTVAPVPALTFCQVKEDYTADWGGVRLQGQVLAYDGEGQLLGQDKGELQFVADGISGIPVFQISRYVARSLEEDGKPYLLLDLFPDWTRGQLFSEVMRRVGRSPDASFGQLMEGLLHTTLIRALAKRENITSETTADKISVEDWNKIAGDWKGLRLEVLAVGGYEKAQVTCGGVCMDEVNHCFELKRVPGLYVTGELLDVDAICGGYNLQWAWTSGFFAGTYAAQTVVAMRDLH